MWGGGGVLKLKLFHGGEGEKKQRDGIKETQTHGLQEKILDAGYAAKKRPQVLKIESAFETNVGQRPGRKRNGGLRR